MNHELILTFTLGLALAWIFGLATNRIGLSPIVGYLLAGFVVGPNTWGYKADYNFAVQMAEIGVILLMFGVGLHFHLEDLLKVRRIAIPGAVGQSLIATIVGAVLVAMMLPASWTQGVVFGISLAVASTVVLVRVLVDNRELHTPTGHIAVGWLIVEDIFTIIVLMLLPLLAKAQSEGLEVLDVVLETGKTLLKLGVFAVFTIVVGGRVVPRVLAIVDATRSRELFTLTVLVIAIGIAVGAFELLGASMPLGAFLAGMVVGRSDYSLRAATEAMPLRDAFAVLFFVSTGMLFNPGQFIDAPGLVGIAFIVVLIAKPLTALLIMRFMGFAPGVTLAVSIALAQVGEFSFILLSEAQNRGLVDETFKNAAVAVAIVSIALNPLLYKWIPKMERFIENRPRLRAWFRGAVKKEAAGEPSMFEESTVQRAIIVGYGPVGRTLSRLLVENEIEPSIIELNLDTVRALREKGIRAVYGNASSQETLEAAGIEGASTLILSSSQFENAADLIRLARTMNPQIQVIARGDYLNQVQALSKAGADQVFTGECETALAMTEAMLHTFGATPEQIDRERARVHEELYGMKDEKESAARH